MKHTRHTRFLLFLFLAIMFACDSDNGEYENGEQPHGEQTHG